MLFGGAVVVFALCFHVILADEPKCLSRFDYDEKMLLKLLRIEDKLEHIEQVIQDMKSAELEQLKQTDQQLQKDVQVLQENMATTEEHSNKAETLLNEFHDNIAMFNSSIGLLQTQFIAERGHAIAFLAKTPAYASNKLIFGNEVLNEGNAYTPTTGEFLAPLPGLYYFSFHLLASRSNTYLYCYFMKNRNQLELLAYAGGTSSSYDSGSMSAFITLKKGDVFHVGNCHGSTEISFHSSSTLTGALIKVVNV